MFIDHVSDTHGCFPTLSSKAEVIIHSGDLCPNKTRGIREIEVPFQQEWLKRKAPTFKEWIGDRPFIFCMGNHDFAPNVCQILKDEADINAIDSTGEKVTLNGIRFYGFPFIPYIDGEWNGECTSAQMHREIRRLGDILRSGIDILIAHAPPYGILDANFVIRDGLNKGDVVVPDWAEHCGNSHLVDLFSYGLEEKYCPKYLLCGHTHEHWGYDELYGIKISNAATKVNSINIEI